EPCGLHPHRQIRLRRLADADGIVRAGPDEPNLDVRAIRAQDERGQPACRAGTDDRDGIYGLEHVVRLPARPGNVAPTRGARPARLSPTNRRTASARPGT